MPTLAQSYLTQTPEKMGLEPLPSSMPVQQGFSAQPVNPSYNSFLATPLPLVATYQPDALRQFYRGSVPQQRIFPVNNG
jgi:hypothetical protein